LKRGGDASGAAQAQIDRLRRELADLKTRIDRLNTAFTDGSLNIDEFKELKNPLVPKKVEIEANWSPGEGQGRPARTAPKLDQRGK